MQISFDGLNANKLKIANKPPPRLPPARIGLTQIFKRITFFGSLFNTCKEKETFFLKIDISVVKCLTQGKRNKF